MRARDFGTYLLRRVEPPSGSEHTVVIGMTMPHFVLDRISRKCEHGDRLLTAVTAPPVPSTMDPPKAQLPTGFSASRFGQCTAPMASLGWKAPLLRLLFGRPTALGCSLARRWAVRSQWSSSDAIFAAPISRHITVIATELSHDSPDPLRFASRLTEQVTELLQSLLGLRGDVAHRQRRPQCRSPGLL